MKTSQKPKKIKTSKRSKNTPSGKTKVKIPVTTKGGLFGYNVGLPEKNRRSLLKFLLSGKGVSYSKIIKRLNVLSIYNKRLHPESTRKVKRDMDFLHKNYRSPKSKKKSKSKRKSKSKKKSKRKSKGKSKRKSKGKSKRK